MARITILKPLVPRGDGNTIAREPKQADAHYLTPQHREWRELVVRNAGAQCACFGRFAEACLMRQTIQLACLACGNPFAMEKPSGRGRYPRFCSAVCRQERLRKQNEQYRTEARYPRRSAKPKSKICVVCDAAFETNNNRTRCCGLDCGQRLASRLRSAARTARSVKERQRICEHCSTPFTARHPSGNGIAGKVKEGRFCSRRCAGAFRTAERLTRAREEAAASASAAEDEGANQLPLIFMMAKSGAKRMAEMRARQRSKIELIHNVPVSDLFKLIDRLIDHNLISVEDASDDEAVAAAIGQYLDKNLCDA